MKKCFQLGRYPEYLWTLTNRILISRLDSLLGGNEQAPLVHPPVFIVGPPRSGSTLAMQVITDVFDFGYISNLHCKWFGSPALAERLYQTKRKRPASNFTSEYGRTKGNFEPAECGNWWYRFYRKKPPYMTLEEVDPQKMNRFRKSVVGLTHSFMRPIIFKNLYASLRIQAINHYLPESLFIVIHRNEVDNAQSLLEARFRHHKNYDTWFSLEPPNLDRLKDRPPEEQVVEQIRETHAIINKDIRASSIETGRVFNLNYEKLCTDPAAIISELNGFFLENNCRASQRTTPPQPFSIKNEIKIERSLYDRLVDYANTGEPTS